MSSAVGKRDTVVQNGWAILMARLVDCHGTSGRPAGVNAIEYSLCELDPCWPNSLNVVAGHADVPLDIEQVLFDEPQVDAMWTVDAVGYNFRHEIDFGDATSMPRAGVQYEIRYEIILTNGQKTIVRFQLTC